MNIEPHLLCTFIAISCGHPLGIVAMHTRTKHTQVVVCCCLSTRVIMNLPATKENYYFERSWHMIHSHTHIPTIETCLHCSIGLHYLLSCVWVFFRGVASFYSIIQYNFIQHPSICFANDGKFDSRHWVRTKKKKILPGHFPLANWICITFTSIKIVVVVRRAHQPG